MFSIVKKRLRRRKQVREWRQKNSHNNTIPENEFDYNAVSVGNYTYGGLTVLSFHNTEHLYIGHFCSIASGVVFALSADHALSRISTFPFKAWCLHQPLNEAVSKGDIIVDDDVWIGQNAIILSGVHIHQGAVIGAGAVVNRDVPPYTIVGGVPAKEIRKRFSPSVVEQLLEIDYSKLDEEMIRAHIDDLYKDIDDQTNISWLPKKHSKGGRDNEKV